MTTSTRARRKTITSASHKANVQRSNPRSALGASQGPEPDLKQAMKLVMELMPIVGPSGQEAGVVEYITGRLREVGVPMSAITTDQAHRKSPLKGEIGNLICKLPGTLKAPRRMLMAHMDTVPLCVGCKPVRKGEVVQSADPKTGLGADDRAGAAVVLNSALEIVQRGLPHPPLTFFWPIQEEVGLHGAQFVQLSQLGNPKLAFNWDGGPAEKVTIGATGAYRLVIEITGLASHAGVAPQRGVSAIAIASLAIADLVRNGWHGLVRKGKREGTTNVGFIQGGGATNVVTDRVTLKAEARSHDPEFRKEILDAIQDAFARAAAELKNEFGAVGKVDFTSRLDYESFRLPEDAPASVAAQNAIRSIGGEPLVAVTNGGLDANWLSARGIPTVTLGCGQQNPHTVQERLDIAAFQRACRIGLRLATAMEGCGDA
jgi:tripeptide aminopeptidase